MRSRWSPRASCTRPGPSPRSAGCSGCFTALGLTPRAALRQARVLAAYLNGAGLALAAWRLAARRRARSAQAAEGDPVLGPLMPEVNSQAVHADLKSGLRRLLDAPLR